MRTFNRRGFLGLLGALPAALLVCTAFGRSAKAYAKQFFAHNATPVGPPESVTALVAGADITLWVQYETPDGEWHEVRGVERVEIPDAARNTDQTEGLQTPRVSPLPQPPR